MTLDEILDDIAKVGVTATHRNMVQSAADALVAAERERWKTLAKNHRTDRKGEYADGWNAALEVLRMWAPKIEPTGAKTTREGT